MRYLIRSLILVLVDVVTPSVAAADCRPRVYGEGPDAFVVLGAAFPPKPITEW
jgi:hypothetical protein